MRWVVRATRYALRLGAALVSVATAFHFTRYARLLGAALVAADRPVAAGSSFTARAHRDEKLLLVSAGALGGAWCALRPTADCRLRDSRLELLLSVFHIHTPPPLRRAPSCWPLVEAAAAQQ